MGLSGKAGGKMQVTDYRMSIHWGIGIEIDALLAIYCGEKPVWNGVVTEAEVVSISQPDLFGGVKKEGGLVGQAQILPGRADQVMPEHLAARLGLTSATCPAYRGLATVFFHGETYATSSGLPEIIDTVSGSIFTRGNAPGTASGAGFLWGSNNPYLRDVWFTGRRAPKGLATEYQVIDTGDGRKNANPAAIIFECIINPNFEYPSPDGTGTNLASFESAAQTLKDEKFGLSLQWTRQTEIESFVQEILDHIQATLYVNPRDGLWTLKLIRGDYDIDDLPVFDESNCTIKKFERKGLGETTNEIVVTWTNPENEQEETVIAQDLAGIAIQGEIISDSRNHYGIRNADLAAAIARRDLASASAPLAAFELEIDRSAWAASPGDCALLNSEEHGISGLVIRLGKVDYGRKSDMPVKVGAFEDIFSLPVSAYTVPPGTAWVDPSATPEPLDYVRVITAPAYFELARGNDTAVYPEVHAAILAGSSNDDTHEYEMIQQVVLTTGAVSGEIGGTKPALGVGLLQADLVCEATSTVTTSFGTVNGATGPVVGAFAIIGATDEFHQEIALITTVEHATVTLARGVLDTVPQAWADGTPVWFVGRSTDFVDTTTLRAASESVRYKLLPRTSRGTLLESEATIVGTVLDTRPHRPNRPANVTVNGSGFGPLDLSSGSPSSLTIAWANRNRTMEDGVVVRWGDATMTPESGQTTIVGLYKLDGTLLVEHTGLTGTSYSLAVSDFGSETVGEIRVAASRDGLRSLQSHSIRVRVSGSGSVPPSDPPPPGGGGDPDPGDDFPDDRFPGKRWPGTQLP